MKTKNRFIFAALVGLFSLALSACGGPPAIGEVVVTKALDADYKAVGKADSYLPPEVFRVSVEVQNIVVGNTVVVKFLRDGEAYDEISVAADEDGSGYYGFSLTPGSNGHIPGSYVADVYLNDEKVKSASFTVEQAGPPAIRQVFAAKSLDEDNQPVEISATFSPTNEIIVSAYGENMVKGSVVKFVLIYEGQSIEETFDVDRPGSQYFSLTYSPGSDGHASGTYKIEVYLDGVLAGESAFVVQ